MSCDISQLPSLVLIEILRRLSLRERLKLKLVCKRWNFLGDFVKRPSLCVYGTQSPEAEYLAYKRPEPNYDDTIRVGSADAVPNLNSQLFKSVDYLYLLAIKNSNFLPDLNCLIYLKELVICRQSLDSLSLKLPNLSLLCLKYSYFKHLELDTEKLTTFVYWGNFGSFNYCSVHFQHPETLKVLEYQSYVFRNTLQEFTNLEHLTGVLEPDSSIDLKQLPKLKTLDLSKIVGLNQSSNLQISSVVQGISQRPEVNIFSLGLKNHLFGVAIYRRKFVDSELDLNVLTHYDARQNPVPFPVWNFNFKKIAETFQKRHDEEISQIQIPNSFFRKIPYIVSIWMNTASDPHNLVDFLRKSRCPELNIINEGHQEFFDQVSHLTSISFLRIRKNGDHPNVPDLNFNFLTNMESLVSLELHIFPQKWPLDTILQAVKKCKFFAKLILHDHGVRTVEVHFRDYTKEAYECEIFRRKLSENTIEELVQYLRENEETKPFCT